MDYTAQPRCILIVDDNPDDRLLARQELHREFPQADLLEAGNAKVFQDLLRQRIDVVITDYQLRWSDGIKILQTVKSLDQNLPVIMFTNSGTQETAVEAMKSGLDDYVVKAPKHLVRLRRAVASAWENALIRRRVAELEGRLQFLLNQLTIGVFRATAAGDLLEINDGLLRLLGLPSLAEAQQLFERQSLLAPLTVQRSNQGWDAQVIRADGQSIWIHVSAALSGESQAAIIDGLVTDITAQKQASETVQQLNRTLERRIQKRTAQLEATNEELEAFAFSVSHDLRAPIRQISGFAGLLEEELSDRADRQSMQRYLDNIQTVTQNASNLVADLLEYSRSGRAEMNRMIVDMAQIVEAIRGQLRAELYSDLQPETQPRQLEWQIDPLPKAIGDRLLLRQVWQNLIENAVKFTRPCHPGRIHIGSYGDGDDWVFFIRDNGIGFDMAKADQLFGVFQRLGTEATFEGSGIGLANVKRIVVRHGGRVWADAIPDQGATFYFSLPKGED
ncbi:hybrid sensor histidine kinase/response regulator [filamentous cyanobacterium CCP5]|nr:hybrid sensor histidine kinase/response regulator [filamentous cyanobacterium CCP5]